MYNIIEPLLVSFNGGSEKFYPSFINSSYIKITGNGNCKNWFYISLLSHIYWWCGFSYVSIYRKIKVRHYIHKWLCLWHNVSSQNCTIHLSLSSAVSLTSHCWEMQKTEISYSRTLTCWITGLGRFMENKYRCCCHT